MAEVACCELCSIKLVTPHPVEGRVRRRIHNNHIKYYLIPESLHPAMIKSGLWSRVDCETTIPTCYMCSEAATNYFTEKERAKYLNTSKILQGALITLGWRTLRVSRDFNLVKLDKMKWDTPEVRLFKLRKFEMVSDFMPDGSLEDSMSRGEGLDLAKKINRDGMAREEVLEAALREVIDTECNRMGDLITGWDNKLEGMKANLSDCSRQLEGVVYEEDIEELTRKADEAIAKANILDARLRKSQDDYSDLKADTTRSITALEEQVHLLKQESRQFQAALQANTRALERLEQAEWRQVGANAAAASTSAARKGKGKRKRREKSHAPVIPPVIPPTSSEAMANARDVIAKKNKPRVNYSFSDSDDDDSSDTDEGDQPEPQPPSKKHKRNKEPAPRPGPAEASTSRLPPSASASVPAPAPTRAPVPAPAPAPAAAAPCFAPATTTSSRPAPAPAPASTDRPAPAPAPSKSIRATVPSSSATVVRSNAVEVSIPVASTSNRSMPPPRPPIKNYNNKQANRIDDSVDPEAFQSVFPSYRADSVVPLSSAPAGSVSTTYRKSTKSAASTHRDTAANTENSRKPPRTRRRDNSVAASIKTDDAN